MKCSNMKQTFQKEIKKKKGLRKIWEEIDKLKGKTAKDGKGLALYNGEGKKVSGEETCMSTEQHAPG